MRISTELEGSDAALLERVKVAAQVLAPMAARIEAERRLPPEAVAALVEAGVFKMLVPRELGGGEAAPATFLAVLEELARADGSVGWVAMISASSALMSGFLAPDTAREIYGAADAITCGVFAPMGRATPVEGGYRVSGRWPFASGCEHSQFRMGGTLVDGKTEPLPGGGPDIRSMLFRAEDTRIVETWDASGLRGTGSHDLEVKDVFVPEARSFSMLTERPRVQGPIHAVPFFGVLAAGVAAVTLGIARAAVDTLVGLAKVKQPMGSRRSIAHKELVQLAVARAEAKVGAARAYLHASVERAVREAGAGADGAGGAGGTASVEARAQLRLAACHAASESAAAVDLMYDAAGATSVYAKSPLQRCFRDVHVATQHIMVSPTTALQVGRVLLGLETDTATL